MQPASELRLHPVDLREFGVTPLGASEYRVVWADSRTCVAYRGTEKLVTSRYQHGAEAELRGKFVLERYLSAEKYYGMPAEQWDHLQHVAVEQPKLSTAQDREIDRFLSTLPREMRAQMESKFSQPARIPVIEPYSHDGEYEFAGLYFNQTVDEGYLKQQIRAHIYRLNHVDAADRKEEMEIADKQQDAANEGKFDEIWAEGRESALMAQ